MGGGDSRPRESRSGEYEPREPDDQQGSFVGSSDAEGDAIQTELSEYTREGNPSEDEAVPEFADGDGDRDREDIRENVETGDEGDNEMDGIASDVPAEVTEADSEGDESDGDGEDGEGDGDDKSADVVGEVTPEAEDSNDDDDDSSSEVDADQQSVTEAAGKAVSQARIKRFAVMAVARAAAQTAHEGVERVERQAVMTQEIAEQQAELRGIDPGE